jgi:hypothetical protein
MHGVGCTQIASSRLAHPQDRDASVYLFYTGLRRYPRRPLRQAMPSQEPPHVGYGAEVMTSMNAAPTRPHVPIVPQNGSVKEKAACSIEDINVWTLPQFEFAGACSFVVQVPN